jgi:Na+-translocating ferredoxin:NAD+ oxidoreductase RNF subunit RnfB
VAHVEDKRCPAGMCRDLTGYEIVAELCNGCHACTLACPTDAVTGDRKKLHTIRQEACISCGACFDACPTEAIRFFAKAERAPAVAGAGA